MIWVFGIVFLTTVVLFASILRAKSQEIRRKLAELPRNQRLIFGVLGSLFSFGSAYLALNVATTIANWEHASFLALLGILVFMVGFVSLQVVGMLCFVSIVIDSETPNDSKRS
jgi:hypothetical protein